MQVPSLPLVLIFGPFDPTGSSSLPADAVTCATLGCHPLSALTATLVQDTASTDGILPVGPELMDDQARSLLEDMNVQAIKVGPLYTPETVSVLAQIAADYNHVPLVLHLTPAPDESLLEDTDTEALQMAIMDLLLPQTDIVVCDHHLLAQWEHQGILAHAGTPAQALLQYGADWVLSTGAPLRPGQGSYMLQGVDNETASWNWQPPVGRLADPDGPLACAITTQLAKGLTVPQAVESAISLSSAITARTFQPGMGHRLINRSTS